MIVIPLDMWRFGYETDKYGIGTIVIYNDGTCRKPTRGNYVCRVYGAGNWKELKPLRSGEVKDWPRQARPVFELVIACLQSCGYASRKKDESSTPVQEPRDEELPLLPRGNQET